MPIVTVKTRAAGCEVILNRADRDPVAIETNLSKVLADALAAELHGALADAYHAGRLYEQVRT